VRLGGRNRSAAKAAGFVVVQRVLLGKVMFWKFVSAMDALCLVTVFTRPGSAIVPDPSNML
jgi:hypothetical protein